MKISLSLSCALVCFAASIAGLLALSPAAVRGDDRAAPVMRPAPLDTSLPLVSTLVYTRTPATQGWIVNLDGRRGPFTLSNGVTGTNLADIQLTQHDADNVYVSSTGIPDYAIGPFSGNPGTPGAQTYRFRLVKSPSIPSGARTATGLGQIGVFVNGVPIFNPLDAFSWNNALQLDQQANGPLPHGDGIWNRNAIVAEGPGFDACLGHPAGTRYHHHLQPVCLRQELGDNGTHHSPIVGWAFDGIPVYGPHGYDAPLDATSPITRMTSSYRARSIAQRHALPNGTVLAANQWGPDVSATYPLGRYVEDFEYVSLLGHLDSYNGRFAKTPEYPEGAYAYFITLDAEGNAAYPYLIGPNYYGAPATDNFGPGQVTVPVSAETLAPVRFFVPITARE